MGVIQIYEAVLGDWAKPFIETDSGVSQTAQLRTILDDTDLAAVSACIVAFVSGIKVLLCPESTSAFDHHRLERPLQGLLARLLTAFDRHDSTHDDPAWRSMPRFLPRRTDNHGRKLILSSFISCAFRFHLLKLSIDTLFRSQNARIVSPLNRHSSSNAVRSSLLRLIHHLRGYAG